MLSSFFLRVSCVRVGVSKEVQTSNCNGSTVLVGTKANSVNGKGNRPELTLVPESAQVRRSTYLLAGEKLT